MDLNAILEFGTPALIASILVWKKYQRWAQGRAPAMIEEEPAAAEPVEDQAPAPAPAPIAPPPVRTLTQGELFLLVNSMPQQNVHVALVGKTGASKTTHATAFLRERSGKILILTHKTDDWWGGMPFIAVGDDDPSLDDAILALNSEADHRRELTDVRVHWREGSAENRDKLEELTIVLDDYSELCKGHKLRKEMLKRLVQRILRLGRSGKMRIFLIADSLLLKSIDMEGEGDIRKHFFVVELDQHRQARVWWQEQWIPANTKSVYELAQKPLDALKAWTFQYRKIQDRDRDEDVENLVEIADGDTSSIPQSPGINAVSKGLRLDPKRLKMIEGLLELDPSLSANAIFKVVGGHSNSVFEYVKQLKES